jgi:hypothetical protein
VAPAALLIALYPNAGRAADDVVVPHPADSDAAEPARTA